MLCVYFSGTGNTRHLAVKLGELLGGEAVSIEDKAADDKIAKSGVIVFAYPVYYASMPQIVREFADGASWRGKKVFLLTTCGMMNGGAIKTASQRLKSKGAKILGGMSFIMPENIGDNAMFMKLMPASQNAKKIARADAKLAALAGSIKRGEYPQKGMRFGSSMAADSGLKPNIDKTKCSGCGLCRKNCPYGDDFGAKCTACYRCYANCPRQAITIFGKKVVEQYRFPE
jgi:flavodoxin/NAD-dependent dihydropyrimidine dehydrogenase PreA subunit